MFTVAICRRKSVCLSSVCNVRAPYTQPVEMFRNVSTPFGILAIRLRPGKESSLSHLLRSFLYVKLTVLGDHVRRITLLE